MVTKSILRAYWYYRARYRVTTFLIVTITIWSVRGSYDFHWTSFIVSQDEPKKDARRVLRSITHGFAQTLVSSCIVTNRTEGGPRRPIVIDLITASILWLSLLPNWYWTFCYRGSVLSRNAYRKHVTVTVRGTTVKPGRGARSRIFENTIRVGGGSGVVRAGNLWLLLGV